MAERRFDLPRKQFQQKWAPVLCPELRPSKTLEQFQQKWAPVLCPELRPSKTLEQFQQKWVPVLRLELRQNKTLKQFRQKWKLLPTFSHLALSVCPRLGQGVASGVFFEHRSAACLMHVSTEAQKNAPRRPPSPSLGQTLKENRR